MDVNEENLKEILEGQREEYQRHLGALVEGFESQVKILAESVSSIQEQLIAIREMTGRNVENIEIIKADIQFIKQALKRKVDIEEFENLEKRVLFLEKKTGRA